MKKIRLVFSLVFFFSISFQLHAQWFWQNPYPTGNNLWAVLFTDSNIGWVVGE
ncbi:MAG: hypothetical protein IPI19_10490 [Ignavibacteriales bacterium]|nr:hypothetical protein [Ignavibacteriales bacterium]